MAGNQDLLSSWPLPRKAVKDFTAVLHCASRKGKTMSPRKIIIDTDPGQDDAIAILLALASPERLVLGITAVAGNVPLSLTEKNAVSYVNWLANHRFGFSRDATRP